MRFKEFTESIDKDYLDDLINTSKTSSSKDPADYLDTLINTIKTDPSTDKEDDDYLDALIKGSAAAPLIAPTISPKTSQPAARSTQSVAQPIEYPSTTSSGKNIAKVVKAGSGYNIVQNSDGSTEKRTGARNWRNNNPGNIKYGSYAQRNGAIGSDGTFAVFPNYETGLKAKENLVFGPSYINLPIQRAVARYAPEKDRNDVVMYTNSILKATGASPNTLLRDLNPQQRKAYLATIDKVEGFKPGMVAQLSGPTVA
jgi:hypothetical protein